VESVTVATVAAWLVPSFQVTEVPIHEVFTEDGTNGAAVSTMPQVLATAAVPLMFTVLLLRQFQQF
jgi:hypothetical protein